MQPPHRVFSLEQNNRPRCSLRISLAMQADADARSQPVDAPNMQPCSVCGTYFKGRRFFRYAETGSAGAEANGVDTEDAAYGVHATEDAAVSSAAPADSDSSLHFCSTSDSDEAEASQLRSRDKKPHGDDSFVSRDDHHLSCGATDSQATILLSQSQPRSAVASDRKRSSSVLRYKAPFPHCISVTLCVGTA
jgi:hypothetical protein